MLSGSSSLILVLLFTGATGCLFYFIKKCKSPKKLSGELDNFITNPEQYHKKIVSFEATVTAVFYDSFQYSIKRKVLDCLNRLFFIKKRRKYRHLRFLVTHPQLKKGKKILVEYNLELSSFISIKKGNLVDLKGEYIHSNTKKYFYGKIHWVHPPKGYLKVLKK